MYFEWSGPAGIHRFEGVWKDPAGREIGRSDFSTESLVGRFAGHWTLLLSATVMPGRRSIESWIDGNLVTTYQFNVRAAIVAAAPTEPRPSTVRTKTVAEIYQAAVNATAFVERTDASGKMLSGSGFFVGPNQFVTAFHVIESATSIRLIAEGQSYTVPGIVAWNRMQDWAILRTSGTATNVLQLAHIEPKVGDLCLAMNGKPGSSSIPCVPAGRRELHSHIVRTPLKSFQRDCAGKKYFKHSCRHYTGVPVIQFERAGSLRTIGMARVPAPLRITAETRGHRDRSGLWLRRREAEKEQRGEAHKKGTA